MNDGPNDNDNKIDELLVTSLKLAQEVLVQREKISSLNAVIRVLLKKLGGSASIQRKDVQEVCKTPYVATVEGETLVLTVPPEKGVN